MPLDAARASSKTEALGDAFAVVGMPARGTSRRERLLQDYWAASALRQLAEPRYQRALKALVDEGLVPDPDKDPEAAGTNRVVCSGSVIEVRLTVAEPIERIDIEALLVDLTKAGVKPALIKRLLAKHTTETRAAHRFTASLVTR